MLDAWTALEALSPQTYKKPEDLAQDSSCDVVSLRPVLPWVRFAPAPSAPGLKIHYQLVLGCIRMNRVVDALAEAFGADDENPSREKDSACIAVILLDADGAPLQENAVAISSLAWALPLALDGKLDELGAWPDKERELIEALTDKLPKIEDDGKISRQPLDSEKIGSIFRWLLNTLNLSEHLCEQPSFAVRISRRVKVGSASAVPPEPALLNSFFIESLVKSRRAIANRDAAIGEALLRYLDMPFPPTSASVLRSSNLLKDFRCLEALLAPSRMPLASWPAHPLVALQQAAVNAARSELSGRPGLFAVNGPPGTGKTTLLRDVVAACVLQRALAMAEFDHPSDAFTDTGERVPAGDTATYTLWELDETLKGHEIIVASSNNKAVENISKELPALKSMARAEVQYFRSVAQQLLDAPDEGQLSLEDQPVQAWGLVAAVMGNSRNRGKFQQAFWWDKDSSMRLYLRAARGDNLAREVKDASGRVIGQEVPSIIRDERPPTPAQARKNWTSARAEFLRQKDLVQAELDHLETVRQCCLQLGPARAEVQRAKSLVSAAQFIMNRSRKNVEIATQQQTKAKVECERLLESMKRREALRPGWLAWLLHRKEYLAWKTTWGRLRSEYADSIETLELREARTRKCAFRHRQTEAMLEKRNQTLRLKQATLYALENRIEQERGNLGDGIIDDEFFSRRHEEWNLTAPWTSKDLKSKREDLFVAALALHRAFIDASAPRLVHNLGTLMNVMGNSELLLDEKKRFLGDLWSSLFMICPVLSTTFASVERMLGDLLPQSIGWLLVDEAGQATPQAAIGAILLAKRVIAVGDPLQVEPVTPLPTRLLADIARHFGIQPEVWIPPQASVQTLADRASYLKAEFTSDAGARSTGVPLLVHRRCESPMFEISNEIAYNGQMVHATSAVATGSVRKTLGASSWLDVRSETTQGKWSPQEGEAVVQLLRRLAQAGVQRPDLYIITPFKLVSISMKQLLLAGDVLPRLGINDVHGWLRDHVGTVHTFQGKEAEAVIAVLGAPMDEHRGARHWATKSPNILNVMVSRAKQVLYVVGSRVAWARMGHAETIAKNLPVGGLHQPVVR